MAKRLVRAFLAYPESEGQVDMSWDLSHGHVLERSGVQESFVTRRSLNDVPLQIHCLPWLGLDVQWSPSDWNVASHISDDPSPDLPFLWSGAQLYEQLTTKPNSAPDRVLLFIASAANLGDLKAWHLLTQSLHPESVLALAGRLVL